jgi:integron integrase
MTQQSKKLLDQVRDAIRRKHYAYRTEESYVSWIRQYILFHKKRHPKEMSAPEIEAFLTYLAQERHVAASTQNQALSAILFLYRQVLHMEIDHVNVTWANKPKRLPTVLSKEETQDVLSHLTGINQLMGQLLYGSGLRLMECLRLRIKDVDFDQNHILVRNGKGFKDRVTLLPKLVTDTLKSQMDYAKVIHERDLANGYGRTSLPNALSVKYPNVDKQWGWQYIFPSSKVSLDNRTNTMRRHHLHESVLQKAVKKAAQRAGLHKPVGPHTFRHCFATHLLESGYDIRTVQELMGHKDVKTTMVYTHVMNKGPLAVRSPLDQLTSNR